ncbi:dihydrodipicolinate synthase family protein [Parablautia sp. Marseille-Q6255]|uniref:dihydrodipicolinate synthase family protein n=1 Tax=Parablautia sp. Marseille-Q6255 TaxID=3039593 RepID=UPI0024BC13B0|nr:dihydrodipicolinate synthase family protein [Parablautia sp. Marseille-Q6255]
MQAKWICPAVTLLDSNGHIDLEANAMLWENLISNGVDGILILGSIGEFFAIKTEEKKTFIRAAVSYIHKRIPLYVGTGGMLVQECIDLSNYALDQGADALVIISPFYFSLPTSSIENFYGQVASQVNGPIILYNFPDRTGYNLSPQLIRTLCGQYPNIIGIKDTTADMAHTRQIIQEVKKEFPSFLVYSGFDEFFLHNIQSGGDGCIAGISNFAPELTSLFADSVRKNDMPTMQLCQNQIDALMSIYTIGEQFIPIIKEAVHQTNISSASTVCMPPLLPATAKQKEQVHLLLKNTKLVA